MTPRRPHEGTNAWSTWLALFVSVLALSLSTYQACDVATTRRNAAGAESIRTSYEIFQELTRSEFEHPLVLHLFETTPQAYRATRRNIRRTTEALSSDERTRALLEERAMADHIFTSYEDLFFNWRHSVETKDDAAFLSADLSGYLPLLLCNPRLQWYWSDRGGRLGANYSEELHDHYDKNVAPKCGAGKPDAKGPFGLDEP